LYLQKSALNADIALAVDDPVRKRPASQRLMANILLLLELSLSVNLFECRCFGTFRS
jgi:hypothetical protein